MTDASREGRPSASFDFVFQIEGLMKKGLDPAITRESPEILNHAGLDDLQV